ncbi:MAG: HD domain-containing protein [Candidatus Sungbacteria bacterium]|uniref:5'-deoxynucleotidase n=1 Tax=Candidatus Sungiibacteriota bacterium TaxID=2750080 RepID=A0A932YXZ4_9BACT|nr:HD domain-containing protein [Candidatus Sungbacteria bacterium]
MKAGKLQQVADFIYECGILSKTPRSGLWFLGTGNQSVAEHLLRTALIGYALGSETPEVDPKKVVLLCILHDLGEARTSDLNYVHQKYGRLAEARAVEDIARSVPFGADIRRNYKEFEEKKTLIAKLAKDADQLEWVATLREEEVRGNTKARTWAEIAWKRLKTPIGRKVGKELMRIHPDNWWFNREDRWFVDRKQRDKKWR